MISPRKLSWFIAGMIIVFGIFGKLFWPQFQGFVTWFLADDLSNQLMRFLQGKDVSAEDQWSLGRYFVYYPIYLLLHLLLINAIFWSSTYRRLANLIFIALITSLIAGSMIFHLLHFTVLYDMTMNITVTFLNLPIILFIVEGGRVLIGDIDKKLGKG